MITESNVDPQIFGPLLLDIGITLVRSGASTRRIRITMSRIASAYQYELHIDMGPKSISLTLHSYNAQEVFNGTRSTPMVGVNFKILSGISRLSWSVTEKEWTMLEIRKELNRLLEVPHYQPLVVLIVVGLAGAAFCYTFGGNAMEMAIVFGATFCGLFVKQQLSKKSFNIYVCTYVSATVAGFFTGILYKIGTGVQLEHAFTTSVLFLIPGVPLINSFTDIIDGEILNGLERGINALIHALAIAFGLSTVMFILNFHGS
ncbi:MAG TPA: threonine/serine exporter family protein [Cyclobacteriaceae bacterium]|nr:threonine/serine exporter family protein [Cyclobacteriaceae bacterium]